VCHNWGKPSLYLEYTWPSFQQVKKEEMKDVYWAHNVWATENNIFVCNTKYGSLYDYKNKTVVWQGNRGITRGLAATDDFILVGNTASSRDRKTRISNTKGAGIFILDRKTFKELDFVDLPDRAGVDEIRILDEKDYCHNGIILESDRLHKNYKSIK